MAVSAELKSLDQVEYNFGIQKILVVLLVIVGFTVAFLANFPLEKKIETLVKTQLAKIPGCRMGFENLRFEFFLPKVVLTDVQVPGSCIGSGTPLKMSQLSLNFRGPSFSPLGVAFKVVGDVQGTPLAINYAAGPSTQVFNIQEEALPLKMLTTLMPKLPKMDGTVSFNTKITLEGQNLQDLQLAVESQNLNLPAQNMNDLKLPRLPLGNLSLKVESQGPRKLVIKEFIIGKAEAPIRGKFTGTVNLAPGAMSFSPIDIKGEAAFTPEFINAFPLVSFMLSQFTQKDGFYQIKLGGTLGNIKPSTP
jgi:type II secretion system protein N